MNPQEATNEEPLPDLERAFAAAQNRSPKHQLHSGDELGWLVDMCVAGRTDRLCEKAIGRAAEGLRRLRRDRAALLAVETKEGLTASEWVMRTADAEDRLREANDEAGRLTEENILLKQQRQEMAKEALAAERELMDWRLASGLLCGGDPEGVTPQALRDYDWPGRMDRLEAQLVIAEEMVGK